MGKPDVESEVAAYVEHLNNLLKGDKDLAHHLPLVGLDLFDKVHDGILLSKVVNVLKPNTINTAKLTYNINMDELRNGVAPGSKAIFEATANQNAFIEGANKIGIKVVNIGAQDLIEGSQDLVLGIVWQLVRAHLLQNVDILAHPELIRLMERHENLRTLIDIGPESLLLRWFNYHLRRASVSRNRGASPTSAQCARRVRHAVECSTDRFATRRGRSTIRSHSSSFARMSRHTSTQRTTASAKPFIAMKCTTWCSVVGGAGPGGGGDTGAAIAAATAVRGARETAEVCVR